LYSPVKEEGDLLRSWARSFGIDLSDTQLHLLVTHLDELWQWNTRINLTGLSTRKKILEELFLDSLIPAAYLPEEGTLLDVGSGAGFPGIPLRILKPRLRTHLLEARAKRVSFLTHLIRRTGLKDVVVIHGRIERDGTLLDSNGYRMITARAVAKLNQVLKWCAPHLQPGGVVVNFQGSEFEGAVEESREVMKEQGLLLDPALKYKLPTKTLERNVLFFRKSLS